jgi:putative hemolysin
MKKAFLILSAVLILVLTGCQNFSISQPTETQTGQKSKAEDQQNTTIANPASVNCVEKGGTIEIRTNKKGEYGVCLFDDNRQCEEWALLRGECPVGGMKVTGYENDAEVYCVITGGQVDGVGTKTPMCKRIDGTYCNAQANFDGDCPDPHDPNPSARNMEAP